MNGAPVSYDAEEAGEIIHQSANWMKTQARARKIPFTRVGRGMVWTPQQLAEILRAGEQRPKPALVPRTPQRRKAASGDAPALQARSPRRKLGAA
jgi:hypothetical protein